ncbi:hypothetical protein LOZ67_005804 [Ophidiomyces ophidiicola]|nr:hypothetical protein LOZ67_005804 [Ophidiomyces ophidiicola]
MRFTLVIALSGASSLVSAQATTPWQRISTFLRGSIENAKAPLDAQLKLFDNPPQKLNLNVSLDTLGDLKIISVRQSLAVKGGPGQELVKEARNVCGGFRQPIRDITSQAQRLTKQGMKASVLLRQGRIQNLEDTVTSVHLLNREFTSAFRGFPAQVLQSCRDVFDSFDSAEKALNLASATWTGLAQGSRTNSAAITGDLCLMGRWYLRLSRTRPHRLRWRRAVLLSLAVFFIIDLLRITSYGRPSVPEPRSTLKKPIPQQRVFIASIHWNNEAILRAHWNNALLDLVRHLGPENVFVSILESGSWDGSKDALRGLDAELDKLGVQRKVVLDETTHADEIRHAPPPGVPGWIWTSRGERELRRIPYLSRLRNRVMEDLSFLQSQRGHRRFDKVLWLNDVIFTTNDVLNLLDTRSGEYAAACSLDFSKPPHYYDTFALRDASGAKAIISTWPYFLSSKSRRALISNTPVPVKSCWNGIIFFDATPFYNTPTLKFRGTADSLANYRLEGSECCLIHADNPLTPTKGVWLNPNVRVGYNEDAYRLVNPSAPATWPNLPERVGGIWSNRIARWTNMPRRTLENLIVKWRLRRWKAENKSGVEESGVHCLINEMQVLVSNGWAHV